MNTLFVILFISFNIGVILSADPCSSCVGLQYPSSPPCNITGGPIYNQCSLLSVKLSAQLGQIQPTGVIANPACRCNIIIGLEVATELIELLNDLICGITNAPDSRFCNCAQQLAKFIAPLVPQIAPSLIACLNLTTNACFRTILNSRVNTLIQLIDTIKTKIPAPPPADWAICTAIATGLGDILNGLDLPPNSDLTCPLP